MTEINYSGVVKTIMFSLAVVGYSAFTFFGIAANPASCGASLVAGTGFLIVGMLIDGR